MVLERLAWAEISLPTIKKNIREIQDFVGPKVALMAVVKANAYGHGAVEVSKAALEAGVRTIGVSSFVEAKELRTAGVTAPIVILGFTPVENYLDMVKYGITVTIRSLDVAKALSTAARREEKIAKVWIKVNTGMNRLGLNPSEVLYFVKKIQNLPNVNVSGIFTHFADGDSSNPKFTKLQIEAFKNTLRELEKEGINIPIRSAANTAATVRYLDSHFDLVRVGIGMYGMKPDKNFDYKSLNLARALSFKTEITQITQLRKGDSVGYGRQFVAKRPTLVATLAVGYGDGFRRAPNNWGEVLIKGQRAPLVGRVSMDQSGVDITELKGDIRRGEEAVLLGKSGSEELTAEEISERLGTISYEVVSSISSRVQRVYINS